MNIPLGTDSAVGLDEVLALALRLPPIQKVRLVERVLMTLEGEFALPEPKGRMLPPQQTWRGLCAELGRAPSADEIDNTRTEVWSNFPRADLP